MLFVIWVTLCAARFVVCLWPLALHCSFIWNSLKIFTKRYHAQENTTHLSWQKNGLVLVPHFSHQLGQIREVFMQVSTLLRVFKDIVLGFEIGFQFCQTVSSLAWQPDSYRAILWQLHKKLFVAFRNLWPFRYFPQQSLYSYASWVVLVSCQTRWSLSFVLDPL